MKYLKLFALIFAITGLIGCESNNAFVADAGTGVPVDGETPTVTTVAALVIGTDKVAIKSDNSDSATITVMALDSRNAAVPGVEVTFASDGGVLASSPVVTGENGEAVTTLRAGMDRANQTITVTASSDGVPNVTIPVQVTGSTVSISSTRTNLIMDGNDTATLTIKAADASGAGVYGTYVNVVIEGVDGTGTLSIPGSGSTNTLGEWSVNLTGTGAGTVRVVASALGASSSMDFIVENVDGSLLITTPASGVTAPINTAMPIEISVPAGTTDLTLVSSLGAFSNASPAAGGSGNILKWSGLASPTTVTAELTSSSIGTASINVGDSNNAAITDNIRLIFVDTIVDGNSTVSLQASPSTVAPSDSTTQNTSELLANVRNANSQPIAGARVTFSMGNATGSGEYVDPPVAYTDAYGVARANFYSGTQSTDSTGLVVEASLWETADSTVLADASSVNIIVGGTAGSIAIGTSTTISSINDNTAYSLPMSVQVTDSGGNAAANTEVNLSVWPQRYALGYWACEPEPGLVRETVLDNEDIDKDLSLGPLEDVSGNGELTPPNSSAGSLPATVMTDENGIATFQLTYLKDYAGFIYNAISATALVQGTETRATRRFWLGASKSDITACLLGESPLNAHWPMITSSPEYQILPVNGSTPITVRLTDSAGDPIAGKNLTATFFLQGTTNTVQPTLDGLNTSSTMPTDANGEAVFFYQSGDQAGTDIIKITYEAGGAVIASYVVIDVQ